MKIRLFRRFTRDDSGATALEYGLLAGLISVMVIVGATTAGEQLDILFKAVGSKLTTGAQNASR